MRRIIQGAVAAGIVAAVSIAPNAGARNDTLKNKFPQESTITRQCDGGTVTYQGVIKMWPPNHKYITSTITAVADNAQDEVTLESTGTHNQMDGDTETNGAGHTADDIVLSDEGGNIQTGTSNVTLASTAPAKVVHTVKLRSERAGSLSDGRTYTLTETAQFGDGEPCTAETGLTPFTIYVPHDMRKS